MFFHIDDHTNAEGNVIGQPQAVAAGDVQFDVRAGVFEVADEIAHLILPFFQQRSDIRNASDDEISAFKKAPKPKPAEGAASEPPADATPAATEATA